MKVALIIVLLLIAGAAAASLLVSRNPTEQLDRPPAAKLSTSAELLMTSLAVAEPLRASEWSNNSMVHGESFRSGVEELTRYGLVQQPTDGRYQASPKGAVYIRENYVISRDGDGTTISIRPDSDEQAR